MQQHKWKLDKKGYTQKRLWYDSIIESLKRERKVTEVWMVITFVMGLTAGKGREAAAAALMLYVWCGW